MNRILQVATEKLNILTVLEEESNFLHKTITMQNKKKEMQHWRCTATDDDLSKLKEISNHQKDQIEV